ncbi:MAG TPA: hypothetical protein VIL94_01660 [Acidothermaceae bacterium]
MTGVPLLFKFSSPAAAAGALLAGALAAVLAAPLLGAPLADDDPLLAELLGVDLDLLVHAASVKDATTHTAKIPLTRPTLRMDTLLISL